ncbi:uncharacterized protein PADG_06394 [Paracoccidioides brasiliensis Pb18]|uniref:Uncharacterized protein n=1 Tax=Paracoccidioides brasiliensis (strain Pb18) TaxID=502780 RepID=C1GGF7_PARBD|nr:uncharacterized protein PADG_06394 [Paracoccidioides brasiliensis Pb18]EEH50315.2 hypothetical protein PADG_06394 [Paracoccidioides brasiliensis Pb18]
MLFFLEGSACSRGVGSSKVKARVQGSCPGLVSRARLDRSSTSFESVRDPYGPARRHSTVDLIIKNQEDKPNSHPESGDKGVTQYKMAKGNDENQSQFTGGYPPTPQEHQVFSNDAEVIGDSDIFLKKGKILQSFVSKVMTSIGTLELNNAALLGEKVKTVYAVSLAEKCMDIIRELSTLQVNQLSNDKEDIFHDISLLGLKDFQKTLVEIPPGRILFHWSGADIQHLRVFERGSPSDSYLLARAAHYITESYEYNRDPTAAAVGSQANVKINDSTTELNDRPSQPIEQTSSPITKTLAQWHVDQGHIHVDAIIALAKALDSGVRIKGLNSQNLDIMI